MNETYKIPQSFDFEKSPMKEAYVLLDATTPQELSRHYTDEDQKLMKAYAWDYKNSELVTNKIKEILEAVSGVLTEDEQKWRSEILWFWYHHAISAAIALHNDIEAAKGFAKKALEYQSEDHPNKITKLFDLLLNDKLGEAEEWVKTIDPASVQFKTAQYLIENFKKGGAGRIVS